MNKRQLITLFIAIAFLGGAGLLLTILDSTPVFSPVAQAPSEEQVKEPQKVFNVEHYTLENGMEIVVIPNHRAPVITHMVWYKVGAADEPLGKSGIAHFMEHLMFKGSIGFAPGEFSEKIRALGGNNNAFTSQDFTAYFETISSEHLETVMRMEAGRMRGMAPPLEEVDSEQLVIMEERRQRTDNDPRARFLEQLNAIFHINHPYGTPVIGWMHEMKSLSWEDAKRFYDRWYGPNNAILIVSGDVSGEQVYTLANEIYGALAPIDVPERNRTISPPLNSATTVELAHPSIHQSTVQKLFIAPSARQNAGESLALQVLEEIMSGGPTARLYKSLVIENKIATGAGLSYNSAAWDSATIRLYATPTPEHSLETLNLALDNELRLLVQYGVTQQELSQAILRLQDDAIYARDSLTGPAMVFGNALATGSNLDDVEYWPYKISMVTAAQIQAVAKKYLDPDNPPDHPPVTGYLRPKTALEPVLSPKMEIKK